MVFESKQRSLYIQLVLVKISILFFEYCVLFAQVPKSQKNIYHIIITGILKSVKALIDCSMFTSPVYYNI